MRSIFRSSGLKRNWLVVCWCWTAFCMPHSVYSYLMSLCHAILDFIEETQETRLGRGGGYWWEYVSFGQSSSWHGAWNASSPWRHHRPPLASICILCVNLIAWAIPHFSWPVPHFSSLPDGAIIIEADGDECNKKTMKSMSWPLMDDDGLPSSYVSKVLTCLSKWRVKMDRLKEALESTEITDSLKK